MSTALLCSWPRFSGGSPQHIRPDAHRDSDPAGYASLNDKAAELGAKLDFFGTGLPPGLLSEYRSDSGSDSEDEEDEDDWQAGGHRGCRSGGDLTDAEQEAALCALPAGVRARLREQSSRLARLEEENLDLKEVRMLCNAEGR